MKNDWSKMTLSGIIHTKTSKMSGPDFDEQ